MHIVVRRLLDRRKEYLNEMSTEWKNIERELGSSSTKEILIHLIKIYYCSHSRDRGHWVDEIYSFYHDIPKQKSNNKYPPADKIYKVIWDYWGDTFDSIEYSLSKDYDEFKGIHIGDEAIEFCRDYIQWLSDRLSRAGSVTRSEVTQKIKSLLNKYNIT